MATRWDHALAGVNSYVKGISDIESTKVTVLLFDESGGQLDLHAVRRGVPAAAMLPINIDEAWPRGGTPLFDAIAETVRMAEKDNPELAAIIIMTDGAENASRKVNRTTAKAMLDACRFREWAVIFLGADFDATAQSVSLGAMREHSLNVAAANLGAMGTTMARKTMAYSMTGAAATMDWSADDRAEAQK